VGYAGGTKKNPTYHDLGDHSESIQIDYDPATITYAQLLDLFWKTHNPCARAWSRQYMSAVWTHNEGQRRLALESKAREEEKRGKAIATEIAPLREFTLAEDYHQKYELRSDAELMEEFKGRYTDAQFVNSTVAMRVNAAIGGRLKGDLLRAEIDGYGLSAKARERLLRYAK
jgi:peptide-methionine (S)-S-oxide reductase